MPRALAVSVRLKSCLRSAWKMACRSISSKCSASEASTAGAGLGHGAHLARAGARAGSVRRATAAPRAPSRCAARARCPARHSAPGNRPRRRQNRALPLGELRDERAGQRQDVLGPLAQRRDVELDHVQPVEQVLAEAARLDLLFQVAVGGGEDARVGAAVRCWSRRGGTAPPASRAAAWPAAAATCRRFHPGRWCRRWPPRSGRCAAPPRR